MLHTALVWLLRMTLAICLFDLLLILLGLTVHYRNVLKRRRNPKATNAAAAHDAEPIPRELDLKL